VAAKAPASPSSDARTGKKKCMPVLPVSIPRRIATKVIHSLTNPFKGGSAEIATAPIRKYAAVQGIFLIKPPSCSIFRV